jgi:hypothetical protein
VPYSHQALAFDPAKAAERSALIGTAVPIQAGDPAYRHLVDVRGLDPAVVLAHPDLRCLHAPILGRPKTDSAFIALLRPAPGEDPTGCEVTFVDALGAKSATDPVRVCWNFIDHGCSRAWFWAGGSGDTVVICEGFGAKALALRSAGVRDVILSGGPRGWLGFERPLPAGTKQAVVVGDRRPPTDERDADGGLSCDRHDRDYHRVCDFLLLQLGDGCRHDHT